MTGNRKGDRPTWPGELYCMRHSANGNVQIVHKEHFVIKGWTMFAETTAREKILTIPTLTISLMIHNQKSKVTSASKFSSSINFKIKT